MVSISIHEIKSVKVIRYIKWHKPTIQDSYYSMTLEIYNSKNERTEITFFSEHTEGIAYDLQFEVPKDFEKSTD